HTAFTTDDAFYNENSIRTYLFCFAGLLFIFLGLILFIWCVSLFAKVGQGTLAPWDPTRNLVIIGPYRFVRNPMICGVILMLFGQMLLWGSWAVGSWACAFICVNHINFVFVEEPGVERRFGESYLYYKTCVPRWIPRLKPWLG
ncbi:MAG TPA: methyltransferase, partial [Candidatus Limnocylindrales bacterium]|nr:methyltransferase [Candidatus Limnocylindrales bacterium]